MTAIRDGGRIREKKQRGGLPATSLSEEGLLLLKKPNTFECFFASHIPKTGFQKKSFGWVQNLYNFFIKSSAQFLITIATSCWRETCTSGGFIASVAAAGYT